jgi:hypothetical protein
VDNLRSFKGALAGAVVNRADWQFRQSLPGQQCLLHALGSQAAFRLFTGRAYIFILTVSDKVQVAPCHDVFPRAWIVIEEYCNRYLP